MNYAEVFSKLTYELAIITFLKKDGEVRVMLGTRNLNTISLVHGFMGPVLDSRDKRCNIHNGNMAVIDMTIREPRQFSIDRLVNIMYLGEINTIDEYNNALKHYEYYKAEYDKTLPEEGGAE